MTHYYRSQIFCGCRLHWKISPERSRIDIILEWLSCSSTSHCHFPCIFLLTCNLKIIYALMELKCPGQSLDCRLMGRFLRLSLSLHNSQLFCELESYIRGFGDESQSGFKKIPVVSKWWTLKKFNIILGYFSGMLSISAQSVLPQSQLNICHRKLPVTELFVKVKTFSLCIAMLQTQNGSFFLSNKLCFTSMLNKSPESQVQNSGIRLRGAWDMYF